MSVKTPNPSPSFLPPEKFFPAPNPSASIDKDELRSEIEFRLSMADVPQKHIKIASNSMEDLISALIDKKVTEALNKQLDEIGEPKLGDFDIEKESYDDVIKCIQWYKSAINQARAQLSKPKEEER